MAEKNPEDFWGKSRDRETPNWVYFSLLGVVVFPLIAATLLLSPRRETLDQFESPSDLRNLVEESERVAQAFVAETDPEQRLRWVRNPDEVLGRLAKYPTGAKSETGRIDKMIGHGGATTAFAVAIPDREVRLLEVIETPDGLKIDWDAYSRYCTESWTDLWSGEAQEAVVRVFCEPATGLPEPFEDPLKWTAFRLSSPELPHGALGFTEVGTVREMMMKKVILGSPRYRQRFVLEVVRSEGKKYPLFKITECQAVGWVLGERPVEDLWIEEFGAARE